MIDDDESEEFQTFLDGLAEEEEDEVIEEPNVEDFIRNDRFIQDYESNDTISSYCRNLAIVGNPQT